MLRYRHFDLGKADEVFLDLKRGSLLIVNGNANQTLIRLPRSASIDRRPGKILFRNQPGVLVLELTGTNEVLAPIWRHIAPQLSDHPVLVSVAGIAAADIASEVTS